MNLKLRHLQLGLSLVEVFIALLVLSTGLIALAKLQIELVRGGADAHARSIAVSLAEEKIEDLRSFARTNASGAWSITANPMAWSYIANNTGGRIASGNITVAGVQYARSWTVLDQNFVGSGGISSRYKDVTITVSWVNEQGVTQSISAIANVVEIPPGNVGLASQPVSVRPGGPQVSYDPGLAPDTVHIDIGGGKKRETTKPLPDVVAKSGTNVVRFDVVNFNSNNKVTRREEFVTVNCACSIDSDGPARTPAHWTYVGTSLREVPGIIVTKTRGSYSATGQNFDNVCVICCRDHHDYTDSVSGTNYRYNPADTSNHLHYKRESNGSYTQATSVGMPYDEACRLKRINGVFQVFEDWNLQAVNVMPSTDLVDGASTQTAYKDYVAALVRKYVDASQATPVVPTFSTTTMAPGASAQLQARTVYIDYMTAAQKAQAAARITVSDNQSVLEAVPWYEVNLTKIANWMLQKPDTDTVYQTVNGQDCTGSTSQVTLAGFIACVANQAIVDESVVQNNYFRGLIKAGPVGGSLDAQGWLRQGNTGITGSSALTFASDSAAPFYSEYRFSNSTVAPPGVSGSIVRGAGAPNGNIWNDICLSYTVNGAGTACNGNALLTPSGNTSNKSFSITAANGASVAVTLTYSGHVISPPSYSVTAPNSSIAFTIDP